MSAVSTRREAIARLVDVCEATWDPDLILTRPVSVDVLLRKALRATRDDPQALAEVRDLWAVAKGRTEPLIDAVFEGLPDREVYRPAMPDWSVEDLEEALA